MGSVTTGQTVYEEIVSADPNSNNAAVSAATFDVQIFKDGATFTGVTVTTALIDATRGIFSSSWSASTFGSYQLYYKNSVTNVIFVSDPILVQPVDETNIYVGL